MMYVWYLRNRVAKLERSNRSLIGEIKTWNLKSSPRKEQKPTTVTSLPELTDDADVLKRLNKFSPQVLEKKKANLHMGYWVNSGRVVHIHADCVHLKGKTQIIERPICRDCVAKLL